MNYSKGDIVVFNGKKHFTKPNGKVFFTIKPGVAKITAVMEGALHPYHLVAVPSDNSTVNGWVDEDTIAKKQMHAKRVEYIPGVGIDVKRFGGLQIDRLLRLSRAGRDV